MPRKPLVLFQHEFLFKQLEGSTFHYTCSSQSTPVHLQLHLSTSGSNIQLFSTTIVPKYYLAASTQLQQLCSYVLFFFLVAKTDVFALQGSSASHRLGRNKSVLVKLLLAKQFLSAFMCFLMTRFYRCQHHLLTIKHGSNIQFKGCFEFQPNAIRINNNRRQQ